eukprot:566217-Amphidinium_carterae.3
MFSTVADDDGDAGWPACVSQTAFAQANDKAASAETSQTQGSKLNTLNLRSRSRQQGIQTLLAM